MNGLIAQQQDDINLLESENAEQTQAIELLRTRTHNNDIALAFRRTDGIDAHAINIDVGGNGSSTFDGTTGFVSGFDIQTTNVDRFGHRSPPPQNVHDDIAMAIPHTVSTDADDEHLHIVIQENDNSDDSDLETGPNYRILHQKSMEVMHDYRSQIIALKQQLFDEQKKREELEQEIEMNMQHELRQSMIRRRSRSQDYHGQIMSIDHSDHQDRDNDGIPLLIKEEDASSPDELQPFVNDNDNDNNINIKNNKSDDLDDKTPKCCRFLFGIC